MRTHSTGNHLHTSPPLPIILNADDEDNEDGQEAIDGLGQVDSQLGGIISHQVDVEFLPEMVPDDYQTGIDLIEWNKAADSYIMSQTLLNDVGANNLLSLRFHREAARLASG